jgi:DNA-binding XRE family transcriptional regulator/uncharacterized protein YjiS (DUF1127 family)
VTKSYRMLLKQAREERGWSQRDVAEKVGTDSKTVSRWERGVASPSPYFRQRLAELFEKRLCELGLLSSCTAESACADGGPGFSMGPAGAHEDTGHYPSGRVDDALGKQAHQPPAANDMPSAQHTRAAALRQQNRWRMLERLRHAYSELLEHSLQHIDWIALGLAGMPDAVENAASRLVRLSAGQEAQSYPPGTSILEA